MLLEDAEGALWTSEMLRGGCGKAPAFDRVVVGVDPATTGSVPMNAGLWLWGHNGGPPQDWRAYVMADCTVQGASPAGRARAAVAAMERFGGDRLVAEVNQGGQMVEEVIRQIDPLVPYRAVHARRGKVARAEPVAALYEQGRVQPFAIWMGWKIR